MTGDLNFNTEECLSSHVNNPTDRAPQVGDLAPTVLPPSANQKAGPA